MIIYDIETLRAVQPHDPAECLPGIEYAADWQDYTGMGIATLCAYDQETDSLRVFGGTPDELDRFAGFAANRIVIGWNNHQFDDRLLAAHGVEVADSWDLKAAMMAAGAGGHRGNSLEATARINLGGPGKRGEGIMAPVWWQRGQRERVIDYCLQDVTLTWRLLHRLLVKGELIAAATGKAVHPVMPLEIHHAYERQATPCVA